MPLGSGRRIREFRRLRSRQSRHQQQVPEHCEKEPLRNRRGPVSRAAPRELDGDARRETCPTPAMLVQPAIECSPGRVDKMVSGAGFAAVGTQTCTIASKHCSAPGHTNPGKRFSENGLSSSGVTPSAMASAMSSPSAGARVMPLWGRDQVQPVGPREWAGNALAVMWNWPDPDGDVASVDAGLAGKAGKHGFRAPKELNRGAAHLLRRRVFCHPSIGFRGAHPQPHRWEPGAGGSRRAPHRNR